MPFEDVDYLKSHSVKESYLFYVDSEKRSKEKFPEPNTYEINFDSPFENVYSLEILDASIPRTQYSIDIHNNQFRYSMDGINWINVSVPTGDYDSDTILPAINNKLNEDIRLDFLSTPSYVKNMFVFISNSQFYLDFNVENSIKTSLGFNQIPRENEKNDDNLYDKYIKYNKFFGSHLINSNDYPYISEQIGYISDNLNSNSVKINNTQRYGNIIEQLFEVNTSGNISSITIFGFDFSENERKITVELAKSELVSNTKVYEIIYTRSNYSVPSFNNSIILDDNSIKFINLNTSSSYSLLLTSLNDSFTFQLTNGPAKIKKYYNTLTQQTSPVISNITDSDGSLAMQINILQKVHTIIAPGVYSLIGDRYVILRCPEIESHLYRSRSYENYTMGLAKFKLATLGYDDTRIDFSGIPPREFHPIGKLKKLTLIFKRPDNETLYNFRGINHTITFAIRYYSPMQEEKLTSSLLAPSYNPDFMKMLQRDSDSESDSDEN